MSEILTDAFRYWELRRNPYNAVLAAVVAALFLIGWPTSLGHVTVNSAELIFVLAILANVAYCAANVVDVAAQSSGYRATWKRCRWMLFVIGVLFASILARFFAAKIFGYAA